MIIRGGENVYPREIEEILHTHPSVQEAQVNDNALILFLYDINE
jgi:acyl-CoA synthetase (AMP-forming)/AMP-acid ligase II